MKNSITLLLIFFLFLQICRAQKPGASGMPQGVFRNFIGLNEGLRWSPSLLNKSADIGIRIMRKDLNWGDVEKKRGDFDWKESDEYIDLCENKGIKVIFILGKTNKVYDSTSTVPIPGNYLWAFYSTYIKKTVERYKGRPVIWELWNEPNVTHMWADMTPRMWVEYATGVMRIIREIDPEATIAGPATGSCMRRHSDNWIWQTFRLFEKYGEDDYYIQNLNAFTGHQYTSQAPDNLYIDGVEMYQLQREIMNEWGYNEIPYCTGERGFTANPKLSQRYAFVGNNDRKVSYFLRQCLWGIYKEPKGFIINYVNYDIYGSGKDIVDTEVGEAMKNMLNILGDWIFDRRIDVGDENIVFLRFKDAKDGKDVRYVIWDRSNTESKIVLPLRSSQIDLIDKWGNSSDLKSGKYGAEVTVGESPLFLIPQHDNLNILD